MENRNKTCESALSDPEQKKKEAARFFPVAPTLP
jgi:hypothetical protein